MEEILLKEKKCNSCHQVKPLSEFDKDSAYKDGIRPLCKDCKKKKIEGLVSQWAEEREKKTNLPTEKECKDCHQIKPISEFVKDTGNKAYTAKDGLEALKILNEEGPFALVVSDIRMPKMDGIQLLSKVKDISPNTVRITLTGYADLETSIEAVHEGNIFRFLTKPCSRKAFMNAVNAGLEQHRLIMAEKELLEKTLSGSIKVLTEMLSLSDPEIFGFAMELKKAAKKVGMALKTENIWQIEMAAMLSQIGYVTLPVDVRHKVRAAAGLTLDEMHLIERVPEIGYQLISHIPRLEQVAKIVRYQKKCFDGSGLPDDDVAGEKIPLGSRVLNILTDLSHLLSRNNSFDAAIMQMKETKGKYDPVILQVIANNQVLFTTIEQADQKKDTVTAYVNDVQCGDVLAADVLTVDNKFLLKAGSKITQVILERLKNYSKLSRLQEPLQILRKKD